VSLVVEGEDVYDEIHAYPTLTGTSTMVSLPKMSITFTATV
jgi:hypothetical protein